jgi:hypothetical protein
VSAVDTLRKPTSSATQSVLKVHSISTILPLTLHFVLLNARKATLDPLKTIPATSVHLNVQAVSRSPGWTATLADKPLKKIITT